MIVRYFVFSLMSLFSVSVLSAEPQVQIELADGATLTAVTVEVDEPSSDHDNTLKPGVTSKWRNDGFIRFGAGLGYRVMKKDVAGQGANAQLLAYGNLIGIGADSNEKWRVLGHVRGTFNIANKEINGPRNLSSGIDFDHNTMFGFSPLGTDKGADFFIGASGNVTGGWNFYSRMQDHVHGSGGIDTGLILQNDVISTIITGSVSAGGAACNVMLPNGQMEQFSTDAWGFGGQLNIFAGDKLYVNARYANYPKEKNVDFTNGGGLARSGEVIKGTIAIELSSKLTLSGNCQIVNLVKQSTMIDQETRGPNGNVTATTYKAGPEYRLSTQLFQIGIIRRFASGDK